MGQIHWWNWGVSAKWVLALAPDQLVGVVEPTARP